MPSWTELLKEIKDSGSTFDITRRKYMTQLFELTGRNVISYYSGWLQKGGQPGFGSLPFGIDDNDKHGFMSCIYEMDKSKGLDLILHTPGGDTAATESIVQYLRSIFGSNIRAIIPQIAMSAGTMIACSCSEIVMGKHSNLGPIDPQFAGLPAHGVIEEFNRAKEEIQQNNAAIHIWQPIIAKYSPTLIGECEKAIRWSEEMVKEWLITGMFLQTDPTDAAEKLECEAKAKTVIEELGSHDLTKSHARHYSLEQVKKIGLNVTALEDDQKLQDAVLSVHHAFILSLTDTSCFKIIENHLKVAVISAIKHQVITG